MPELVNAYSLSGVTFNGEPLPLDGVTFEALGDQTADDQMISMSSFASFEASVEFSLDEASDAALDALLGIPAPRRAVEGVPIREGFFPGRRIEYYWVQVGDWLVREDALPGMVEGMVADG